LRLQAQGLPIRLIKQSRSDCVLPPPVFKTKALAYEALFLHIWNFRRYQQTFVQYLRDNHRTSHAMSL
jgi:hypothetical protein